MVGGRAIEHAGLSTEHMGLNMIRACMGSLTKTTEFCILYLSRDDDIRHGI